MKLSPERGVAALNVGSVQACQGLHGEDILRGADDQYSKNSFVHGSKRFLQPSWAQRELKAVVLPPPPPPTTHCLNQSPQDRNPNMFFSTSELVDLQRGPWGPTTAFESAR
eukprot:4198314-Pyramimonas_sp.AAC.2